MRKLHLFLVAVYSLGLIMGTTGILRGDAPAWTFVFAAIPIVLIRLHWKEANALKKAIQRSFRTRLVRPLPFHL